MTELIQKAITGDAEAIEQLVHLHKAKLIATAFSYIKNYEEAQDIVQETFLKAFQSLHQLKEPKYFSTWLYKILIRHCFSALNKKKTDNTYPNGATTASILSTRSISYL